MPEKDEELYKYLLMIKVDIAIHMSSNIKYLERIDINKE